MRPRMKIDVLWSVGLPSTLLLTTVACAPSVQVPASAPDPSSDYQGAVKAWMQEGELVTPKAEDGPKPWAEYDFELGLIAISKRPDELHEELFDEFGKLCARGGGQVASIQVDGKPAQNCDQQTVNYGRARCRVTCALHGKPQFAMEFRRGEPAKLQRTEVRHYSAAALEAFSQNERSKQEERNAELLREQAEQDAERATREPFEVTNGDFADENLTLQLKAVGCDGQRPVFKYRLSNTSGKYVKVNAASIRVDGVITTFKWNEPADIPPEGWIAAPTMAMSHSSQSIPCDEAGNSSSLAVGASVSYAVDGATQSLNAEHDVSLSR